MENDPTYLFAGAVQSPFKGNDEALEKANRSCSGTRRF